LINLDFADVKSIMKGMGVAFMGTGIAGGENRAAEAANKAICSPLLIDTSIEGAKGVLINITGGKDLTLHEVSKASQLIHKLAHPEANIIFGTVIDSTMKEMVKVTVIATGFERGYERPVSVSDDAGRGRQAHRKTPPPFPVPNYAETPPFPFEPQSIERREPAPSWTQPLNERGWDDYETPSFIRNKHSQLRKYPS
jgi:cell division protein FtsZ